jgi:hypothetical protein
MKNIIINLGDFPDKLKGGSLPSSPPAVVPTFDSVKLSIPPFFAVPYEIPLYKRENGKRTKSGVRIKWRLANPLTEMRNLATRKGKVSIDIKRTNVTEPMLDYSIPRPSPRYEDFSKKDQMKLQAYFKAVKDGKQEEYLFKNKQRGFPAILYKNVERVEHKEVQDKLSKITKGQRGRPRKQQQATGNGMISDFNKISDLYSSGDDDEEQGGSLLHEIGRRFKHLMYGRNDAYPPSVKVILDRNADAMVEHIELHRSVLSSIYTSIMNVWTKGETEKRLKEQPKDKLFHISMWVKLSNGKTISVEKREVIHMEEEPKRGKEEETQPVVNVPANLRFGDMIEKTRNAVGSNKFFTYSAKDNNCGNFIEMILKANGLDSQATHDFIGQDAKTILQGFPNLRKTMNTLTDIAGRVNVVMEGGELNALQHKIKYNHNNITMRQAQEGSRLFNAHYVGHPALISDRYPRVPQAFTQIHLRHPVPIGSGLYAGGQGLIREEDSNSDMEGEEYNSSKGRGILRPKKFVKGSKEAREHMASLRAKRGKTNLKGGKILAPPSRSPVTDPSLI